MNNKGNVRQSLQDALAVALPQGFVCKVHHVYTPSKPCDPLFSSAPGHVPEKTLLASHFLTVSVLLDRQDETLASSSPGSGIGPGAARQRRDVLVLGMEVFVYTTKHLTTIFVGKADSTGYLANSATRHISPVKAICTAFLQWLSSRLRQRRPSRTIVISLFARAQAQYLFPGSSEHDSKHILDDRQLVKWWAKVLNPIVTSTSKENSQIQGYLTIPGYNAHELKPYLPRDTSNQTVWKAGNPLKELGAVRGESPNAPPRCLLPRFPDDPKARYMSDLDDEVGMSNDTSVNDSPVKNRTRKWKTIATIDRFWEAMEFRQECSSGRVVGFLWVVMSPVVGANDQIPSASQQTDVSDGAEDRAGTPTPAPKTSPSKRRRKPLTGPIIPRQPRLKGGSSALAKTKNSGLNGTNIAQTNDGVSLSKSAYDKAMHTLLHVDFCNLEVAALSTAKWIADVSRLSGCDTWALNVTGTSRSIAQSRPGEAAANDMSSMVRKKRKAVDGEEKDIATNTPAVNVLGSGMVRKKAKKPIDS
nr:histone acetyltransferase [Quercus suber]